MKRFLIWISVVIITFVLGDCVLGFLFATYTKTHGLRGDYESIEEIIKHNNNDLLILGSSVALCSVNPQTLEDSLHLVSFNAGGNGQEFPFSLTIFKAALKQKAPKVVLLCLQPYSLSSTGIGSRYKLLVPYYGSGISDIDENLNKVKPLNKYLLKVSSYKLNNIWFRIVLYHFFSPDIRGTKGHIAKTIPPMFPEKDNVKIESISEERRREYIDFLKICNENNIRLVVLLTPHYENYEDRTNLNNNITQMTELAEEYGAIIFNDIELEPFASHAELFYDSRHINLEGTRIYTDTILNRIKGILDY